MGEDLFESVMHRAGEVFLETHLNQEAVVQEFNKVLPDPLRPHLIPVRAFITDGFYPLTPNVGLFVKKVRDYANVNQLLATSS